MNKTLTVLIIILVIIVGLAVVLEISSRQKEPETAALSEEVEKQTGELQIETLVPGSGSQEVTAGDTITIDYTGWLVDGTKFDSSIDAGTPFTFPVGTGRVIVGFDQGVVGMKVGEERKLSIPSRLGYGTSGFAGIIPPNADLVFEVKLLSITSSEEEQNIETTVLEAVGDYEGSGTATRVFNELAGVFTHTVTVQLDEPAEGMFYQGWLTRQDPVVGYFSTGMLEKDGDNYVLTYIADEDQSDYNQVVITEESEDDDEPETHVLEGSF